MRGYDMKHDRILFSRSSPSAAYNVHLIALVNHFLYSAVGSNLIFTEGHAMNSDQMQGKWKQMKGSIKEKWGKLTDDDIDVINGQHDQLVGKIQERYGIAKEEARKQVDEFMNSGSESDLVKRRAS